MPDRFRYPHPAFPVLAGALRCGLFLLGALLLMALGAASCGETPVDSQTANVTRRAGHDSTWVRDSIIYRDSIIRRDTTIYRDSLIRRDTLIVRDSIVWRDSLLLRDSLILRTHDSVIIAYKDSLRITIHDSVVTRFKDSTRIRDSIRVIPRDSVVTKTHDSVVIIRRDTLIRRYDTNFVRFATLYYHDPTGSTSRTLLVDSTTKISLGWTAGILSLMKIDFMARPPDDPWVDGMLRSPSPYWMHLDVPGLSLSNGQGLLRVSGDPVFGSGLGVLQHIRAAPSPIWMTTANALNAATFQVDRVDTVARTVYSKFHAEFARPDTLKIDSVRIVVGY
ncbi:MAG: hypothetical protein JWQ98_2878 [Chlorobi bacterium]|nr:hypothetical protein [Chlorobiota bacterium]